MVATKQKTEKFTLGSDAPGHSEVLLGNEAIARGIIEAGVQVAAAYPGTPSTEILETLAKVSKQCNIYAEWSTNEKVALEVAMAGSMASLRSVSAVKSHGLNVAMDFLVHLPLWETGDGGLLVVICDDPEALSSSHEQDSRWIAHMWDFPMLEPAFAQEGKEMAKWSYDLSEKMRSVVFMRSVTRISHSSSVVTMGEIQHLNRKAKVDLTYGYSPFPVPKRHPREFTAFPVVLTHARAKRKMEAIEEIFNESPFNRYEGPESPRLTIICSGTGYLNTLDALDILGLRDSIGIIKLGTTWPLPMKFIEKHLKPTAEVLVIEEVDPFIETLLKERLYGKYAKPPVIYGKNTGHMSKVGELNPDRVMAGITKVLEMKHQTRNAAYDKKAKELAQQLVIDRTLAFCPGCPHRASIWIMKNVLRLDDTDGFAPGDVGCLGLWPDPQMIVKSNAAMGSSTGLASGFGKFKRFGFNQLVMAMSGDSTFFHAGIPALINAVHHRSNLLLLILDNRVTAMTGFQPHPGSAVNAVGEPAIQISMEQLCRTIGCQVEITDPFNPKEAQETLLKMSEQEGVRVLIMRQTCGLVNYREKGKIYTVWVDQNECLGEECGCGRYCNRSIKCPALIWDAQKNRATIDEALCVGCGFCTNICPRGAIKKELKNGK